MGQRRDNVWGQQETRRGTTARPDTGHQETRQGTPRVDEWSDKAVVCPSIWSSQRLTPSIPTSLSPSPLLAPPAPRVPPQTSCLSRLSANHRAANYDAGERVTTGRGWATNLNTRAKETHTERGERERFCSFCFGVVVCSRVEGGLVDADLSQRRPGLEFIGRSNLCSDAD